MLLCCRFNAAASITFAVLATAIVVEVVSLTLVRALGVLGLHKSHQSHQIPTTDKQWLLVSDILCALHSRGHVSSGCNGYVAYTPTVLWAYLTISTHTVEHDRGLHERIIEVTLAC